MIRRIASFRTVTIVAAVAAAMLVGFVPTAKAENLRTTPQLTVGVTDCGWGFGGSRTITPDYYILAANRYYNYVEGQNVYVRTALHQWTSNGWAYVATDVWLYGRAFDNISPQTWSRLTDGGYLGDATYRSGWTVRTPGHFRLAVQFAWDRSSTGASSDSSEWFWSPNYCTN